MRRSDADFDRVGRHPLTVRIHRRVCELLLHAAPLCAAPRAPLPEPILRFDLTGQAAGQAVWRPGKVPVLRFNLVLAHRHTADFVERTVAHEVAHLVTAACFGATRPHGREWKAVMALFGIRDASRCHDYSLDESQVRRQRRWSYRCDCTDHLLSTTRHKRVEDNRARYQCRQCGSVLRREPTANP